MLAFAHLFLDISKKSNKLRFQSWRKNFSNDFALFSNFSNNVIVVCKQYYIETLIKELGINTTNISPNSTYIPSTDSFDEILKSQSKFIESVGLEMSEEEKSLPYLYWTPKLHKVPFTNIASLLAPVNVPQKICYACSPKC